MIEIKISGNNLQELTQNAMATLVLIANGARASMPPKQPVNDNAAATADAFPASDQVGGEAEALKNPSASEAPPEQKGRKPKAKPTSLELKANPPVEPKTETSDVTIEQCRDSVRLSLENYVTRARDGGETDEKKIMAGKVDYVKPLFAKFGIKKVSDLKPEQFADFVSKAAAYVDGTAPAEAA
jgi:hypothetical protein